MTDPSKVAGEIFKKILSRLNISDFANIDIAGANKSAEEVKSAIKDLKNIFSQ